MNSLTHFFPSTIILVTNPTVVCNFFLNLFSIPFLSFTSPFNYYVQKLSTLSSLILIDSLSCEEELLNKLTLYSVKYLFLYLENYNEILTKAINFGGKIHENKVENESNRSYCTIEGPEGIIIYLSTFPKNGQSSHEWIMSTIGSSRLEDEDDDDDEEEENDEDDDNRNKNKNKIPTPRHSVHPRPIIHTLDVSLLSKNGFIPCPPNLRKPTPFETEVNTLIFFFLFFVILLNLFC